MAVPCRILVLIIGLVLTNCTTPDGASPGATTATLFAAGPQVYVNDRPARSGMPIRSGDRVRTGGGSSALVRWSEGTTIQVDQNSDPLFIWSEGILYVNCGYGWFLFDTGRLRVRVENELSEILIGSRAALRIVPGRSFDAYLLEGRLDLLRPPGPPLMPGEKVLVGSQGILAYAPISPEERISIERRFARWEFAAAPERQPQPWLEQIVGTVGTIVLNPRERQPAGPPPAVDEPRPRGELEPIVVQPVDPRFPLLIRQLPLEAIQGTPGIEQDPR